MSRTFADDVADGRRAHPDFGKNTGQWAVERSAEEGVCLRYWPSRTLAFKDAAHVTLYAHELSGEQWRLIERQFNNMGIIPRSNQT
jgi:hypothetical protein